MLIVGNDISQEDCILHQGAVSAGYGHVWNGDKVVTAHRLAYQRENGLIPEGMQIHHLCHTRLCINPKHLIALLTSDHQKLHYETDIRIGFHKGLNTHCPQGHLLDSKNERQRFCSICKKQHQNEYSARNREITNAKSREWKLKNIEKVRKWNREYMRNRRVEL
jgi:hypothetical protein